MNERGQRPELSEQFQLSLAYFNFIRLAQTYGQNPSRNEDVLNPDLSPLLSLDARTLRVVIPPVNKTQVHSDFISGVDYGSGYNVVAIFYRKGDSAFKVSLKLNEKTGIVKIHKENVFKVIHSEELDHPTYEPGDKTKDPSISAILDLLESAEEVLQGQEKARLTARFDNPKQTIRQRLSKGIEDFLK